MEHYDPMPTDWLGRPAPWMRAAWDVLAPLLPKFTDRPRALGTKERDRRKRRNKAARMSRRNNRRG